MSFAQHFVLMPVGTRPTSQFSLLRCHWCALRRKKSSSFEDYPCNHHLPDPLSETIQEKRKNHYSFVGSCPVSIVFRHVRSTQKEQHQQPQRDTLSDEHLVGTPAGVVRSRAVRRHQEPARWAPLARTSMLFTPWSPHLKLPGRPRSQRSAYEEPVEAGALPRFIETPTPTADRNPKSEKFVSDAEQSTKRQRQKGIPRESRPASSSSCAAADTSMQIPDLQTLKLARPFSLAERDNSIQKRQRPVEVNTVWTTAGWTPLRKRDCNIYK